MKSAALRWKIAALMILPAMPFAATAAQSASAVSQAPALAPEPVTVGVYLSPPFVVERDGRYSGMAIEVWQELASKLHLQPHYVEFETFGDLVDATAAGKIDVAVTNLTMTRHRAERIDFTQPWFDSGLRVMVNENRGTGLSDVLRGLRESGHLRTYALIGTLILAATLLLTLFDRRYDSHFPQRWRDGVAESFYTIMSIATSGKSSRKNLFGWIGRLWEGLWLACGVAVLAYVTSSVTSVMTTLSLSNQINSVADLSGHRVGVLTGSTSEQYARAMALEIHSFAHIEEAAGALVDGRIEAIVGDAPVLEYYAHSRPRLPLAVVGPIFEPHKYGFGLPHGSKLTRPLTIELIGMHETGQVEESRRRYFGDSR